jgi:hypothetical protein
MSRFEVHGEGEILLRFSEDRLLRDSIQQLQSPAVADRRYRLLEPGAIIPDRIVRGVAVEVGEIR